jgi:hypothetical protein
MMHHALTIIYVLITSSLLYAQGTIIGKVTDENREALPGAHVVLHEDSSHGVITDRYGNFKLENVPAGQFHITVSFVGYENTLREVEVTSGSTSTLTIALVVGNTQLRDLLIRGVSDQTINTLTPLDIQLRPVNTSQDILRMVPGLFIAQHAGGGKAEQIFLRGFDIDHGTDLNVEVDGLPVNMVSHAHGQGYSDLHFIIPELIQYVDFDKGPYYANKGNFTTAGFVEFQTKNVLDENLLKTEMGQFGTLRAVAGVNLFPSRQEQTKGYVASEYFVSDGFVESPQNFSRFNIASKISTPLKNGDDVTFGASFFTSQWNASGQIPMRAVYNGTITRFGSIDDSEGGNTSRANFFVKHLHTFSDGSFLSQQAYATRYNFNLYSNFTFYLNDPLNGDQINQKESRTMYGYKSSYNRSGSLFKKQRNTEIGGGFRLDDINDISLSNSNRRSFLRHVQRGNITEANMFVYLDETLAFSEKWSLKAAARFDHIRFIYHDKITHTKNTRGKSIVNPKLTVNYKLNDKTLMYLRSGFGFHSNDARVITQQIAQQILPRAYGIDLGMTAKVTNRLFVHAALWRLDLDQEFVYVGDEGIVEPSGETQRIGLDLSLRYEVFPWLFFDGDVNVTSPKAKGEPEGQHYIPLAPTLSSIGGFSFKMKNGLNGTLRYRYIADRAANEGNSVVATGYTLIDALINYTTPTFEIGMSAENIFNTSWNEAQFDTASRLREETEPVSEIHFTPGTPLFFRLKVSYFF